MQEGGSAILHAVPVCKQLCALSSAQGRFYSVVRTRECSGDEVVALLRSFGGGKVTVRTLKSHSCTPCWCLDPDDASPEVWQTCSDAAILESDASMPHPP